MFFFLNLDLSYQSSLIKVGMNVQAQALDFQGSILPGH